jgi:hypothetical protein
MYNPAKSEIRLIKRHGVLKKFTPGYVRNQNTRSYAGTVETTLF